MSGDQRMQRRRPRWPSTTEEVMPACEFFRQQLRAMYAEEVIAARRDPAELAELAAQELRAAAERELAEWQSLVAEAREVFASGSNDRS